MSVISDTQITLAFKHTIFEPNVSVNRMTWSFETDSPKNTHKSCSSNSISVSVSTVPVTADCEKIKTPWQTRHPDRQIDGWTLLSLRNTLTHKHRLSEKPASPERAGASISLRPFVVLRPVQIGCRSVMSERLRFEYVSAVCALFLSLAWLPTQMTLQY